MSYSKVYFKMYIFEEIIFKCVCVCVRTICTSADPHRSQGYRMTMELELKVTVSCLMWVLGIAPRFSGTQVSLLNHRGTPPAPTLGLKQNA